MKSGASSNQPKETRVAVLFSTALVTAVSSRERTEQYLSGFRQWLRRHPNLDYFWADNTVADLESLDPRFKILRARIGNGRSFFFENNSLGRLNKGAGVILQLRSVFELEALEPFEWVLFFEPRQTVVAWWTIDSLLHNRKAAFWIEGPNRPGYRFKSHSLPPDFYTGVFMLRVEDLRGFIEQTSAEDLVEKSDSLEATLYKYVRENGIPFQELRRLWVRRTRPGGKKEYR